MMILGAMMLIGALSLLLYNRHKEKIVGDTSEEVVNQLADLIKSAPTMDSKEAVEGTDSDDDLSYNLETAQATTAAPDEETSEVTKASENVEIIEPETTQAQTTQEEPADMEFVELEGYTYIGILDIPALGLSLPIQWGWSNEQLDISPCRYDGTIAEGNLILLAHNYSTHFGTIKNLNVGDELTFTDVNGVVYRYVVSNKESFHRNEIAKMYEGEWDMTLFTCVPNTYNRLAVRCTRVAE
ncbi:MAG: sortase [Lachnospiraceae bacterium]|nr:sortase [Lachnospiraceae bacterium]